ncbi:hypothetical protein TNCV_245281 [Trichonephila clavipes]|nr:hypothetical protein TNCV_245281 [Trichonephila clavipes]
MAAVDFLHHENPATWTGVETATLGIQGQRQTNYAPASKECTRKIRAPRTAPGNIFSGEESQWGRNCTDPLLLDSFWQQASSSNVNQGQVTKPAPPLLTSTPHQWEKARALDRFNVNRSPTGWVFSGLELKTRRQRFRYLDH